jgi:hypothetical protein
MHKRPRFVASIGHSVWNHFRRTWWDILHRWLRSIFWFLVFLTVMPPSATGRRSCSIFLIWIINTALWSPPLISVFSTILPWVLLRTIKLILPLIKTLPLIDNFGGINHSNLLIPLSQLSSSLLLPILFKLFFDDNIIFLSLFPPDIIFNQFIYSLFINLIFVLIQIILIDLALVFSRVWLSKIGAFWLHYLLVQVFIWSCFYVLRPWSLVWILNDYRLELGLLVVS